MEPFCSLGGTGRAGTRYGSIKLGLAFVNVSGLKASTGRMGPGNKHQTEVNSEGVFEKARNSKNPGTRGLCKSAKSNNNSVTFPT